MSATIEVSYGELADKITILEIKASRIVDAAKLDNIKRELSALNLAWSQIAITPSADLDAARSELKRINEVLWEIEDTIRIHEKNRNFDTRFIELARSVYITNDERARIKKTIDRLLGSRFSEEKSYQPY